VKTKEVSKLTVDQSRRSKYTFKDYWIGKDYHHLY
jgi:hypothetical protein